MSPKPKNPKNQYFTQETEDAIVRFNNETDPAVRSRIWEREIHYPFFKLTENIIHTFKFYYTEVDEIEHLQHEIMCFLLEKLHLFDPSKGAKAFSYFGTIVKRWLILYNQKNYKKRIDSTGVEEIDKDDVFAYTLDYDPQSKDRISDFMDEYIDYCFDNLDRLFPKQTDREVADAIITIFSSRENIDIFNKKALYIYIREMVDVKTPHITRIARKLADIYTENYIFYQENGYTNFD